MKKNLLLFAIVPFSLFCLVGCESKDTSKTNIAYGRIYSSKPLACSQIEYDEIQSKVDNKECFAIAISHKGCGCWTTFEPVLRDFNYKHNLDIRYIDESEFAGNDKFGLRTYAGDMPSVAIFKNGKLARQVIYGNGSTRDIFTKLSALEKFFFENANSPKMYYIEKETLDEYILSEKEFNLYVARSLCNDCQEVNRTALKDWNLKNTTVNNPLYIFDIQEYYGKDNYQGIKDTYGLSTANNPILGYGTGSVPTFQHRVGNEIKDMTVVFNDYVNRDTKVLSSYFTQERVSNMPFLKEYGDKYVLNGITLSEAEASHWGYGTDNSAQIKRHSEILNIFLKKYAK